MNNTLSMPRLMRLMRKHWIENFSFYSMAALAIFGLFAVVLTIWLMGSGSYYSEESLYVIYLSGLFIAGCIFAGNSFGMLGDKAKGGYWLALPASHLEKLITTIFFTTIVFFAVYSACFYILKPVAVAYINSKIADHPDRYHYDTLKWEGDGFGKVFYAFLFGFVALQALYLMGSAFFSKHAFIKTTIITAALAFLLAFYTYKLGNWVIPKNVATGHLIEPSERQKNILLWILKLIWAPIFWFITWFRLREKEL